MKKLSFVFLIFLALAVFCACTPNSTSEESSSSETSESFLSTSEETKNNFFDAFETFEDRSGEKIDFENGAMKSFELDYVLGWNLTSNEYKKIRLGTELFGYQVSYIDSNYTINYGNNKIEAVCDYCSYSIPYKKGLAGVFVLEEYEYSDDESALEKLYFYPYYFENGEGFYLLHERDEISEQELREKETLVLPDGTEKKVQPFSISCSTFLEPNDGYSTGITVELLEELTGVTFDKEAGYLEATVLFSSIGFTGQSQASGESIYRTVVSGTFTKILVDQ